MGQIAGIWILLSGAHVPLGLVGPVGRCRNLRQRTAPFESVPVRLGRLPMGPPDRLVSFSALIDTARALIAIRLPEV